MAKTINFLQDEAITLQIRQNYKIRLGITWKNDDDTPVNLTNYTSKAQIRINDAAGSPIVALTETVTDKGFIERVALSGETNVTIYEDATVLLTPNTKYFLEVQIIDSADHPEESLLFTLEVAATYIK